MNYGWGDDHNTWYTLDALWDSDPDKEFVLTGIQPNVSLDESLAPTYARNASFPYRYVNVDTSGVSVFEAGQLIQFLPNCKMTGGPVVVYGGNSPSVMFTRGDTTKGGYIYTGGAMRLSNGGGMIFH
jgi:hypothetical protein